MAECTGCLRTDGQHSSACVEGKIAARDAEWREALRRWWAVCGRCGSIAEACKCTEGDAVRALLAGGTRG